MWLIAGIWGFCGLVAWLLDLVNFEVKWAFFALLPVYIFLGFISFLSVMTTLGKPNDYLR